MGTTGSRKCASGYTCVDSIWCTHAGGYENDFAVPGITFQIGVEPVRIDIITAVDGLTFDAAWPNRVASEYGGEPVFVISREDLISNKRASGRPQDIADIAALERLR